MSSPPPSEMTNPTAHMATNRIGGTGCPTNAAHVDTAPTNAMVPTASAIMAFHVIERINVTNTPRCVLQKRPKRGTFFRAAPQRGCPQWREGIKLSAANIITLDQIWE